MEVRVWPIFFFYRLSLSNNGFFIEGVMWVPLRSVGKDIFNEAVDNQNEGALKFIMSVLTSHFGIAPSWRDLV